MYESKGYLELMSKFIAERFQIETEEESEPIAVWPHIRATVEFAVAGMKPETLTALYALEGVGFDRDGNVVLRYQYDHKGNPRPWPEVLYWEHIAGWTADEDPSWRFSRRWYRQGGDR